MLLERGHVTNVDDTEVGALLALRRGDSEAQLAVCVLELPNLQAPAAMEDVTREVRNDVPRVRSLQLPQVRAEEVLVGVRVREAALAVKDRLRLLHGPGAVFQKSTEEGDHSRDVAVLLALARIHRVDARAEEH